jgi:PIN like domain
MRNAFRQYFKPTNSDLRDLWEHGLFSFDASVLLSIYGYSGETRQELVNFVEKNALRVRLPHQFGLEYARNRGSVIVKQVNKYLKVEKELKEIKDNDIAPKRDHPYLTKKSLRAYQAIQDELAKSRKAIEKLIGSDPYAERLLGVFDGRVGDCPTSEELSQLHSEAKNRYERKIPPGFSDLKKKDVPDAYGDYIAWHQLMQIAKAEKQDFILVVDDLKDDWWYIERERTVGPRPELLAEFAREAQQHVYMYTSESFLRAAREYTSADIGDEVIEEVTLRLASERATQRGAVVKSVPTEAASASVENASGAPRDKTDSPKKTSPGTRGGDKIKLRPKID